MLQLLSISSSCLLHRPSCRGFQQQWTLAAHKLIITPLLFLCWAFVQQTPRNLIPRDPVTLHCPCGLHDLKLIPSCQRKNVSCSIHWNNMTYNVNDAWQRPTENKKTLMRYKPGISKFQEAIFPIELMQIIWPSRE